MIAAMLGPLAGLVVGIAVGVKAAIDEGRETRAFHARYDCPENLML